MTEDMKCFKDELTIACPLLLIPPWAFAYYMKESGRVEKGYTVPQHVHYSNIFKDQSNPGKRADIHSS
jgi:hypothetical protein